MNEYELFKCPDSGQNAIIKGKKEKKKQLRILTLGRTHTNPLVRTKRSFFYSIKLLVS